MTLLERTDLMDQLTRLLDDALQSKGHLVCVLGEAGIGKSSLARAFADKAGPRVRVLRGACEDFSIAEPLGPIREVMRAARFDAPADLLGSALFAALLDELAKTPTLVVIEDLHWADDATVDFLRFLGRRGGAAPILTLVTARDDSEVAETRIRRATARLPSESTIWLQVAPLSKAATIALAKSFNREDGEDIYALTNGNPFLTTEVLRSHTELPETVRQAILWQADRLSAPARDTLLAASIFPRRVEAWLLESFSSAGPDSIEECVASGLLRPEPGNFYSFRHEITRRSIESSITPTKRRQLNVFALAALRAREPSAYSRLIHHALEAQDADAIRSIAPEAGAEAAKAGAHQEAARHYTAALVYAESFEPRQRADLFERCAFELQLLGRNQEAVDLFKRACAIHTELGALLRAGDTMRWIGRLSYNAGNRFAAAEYAHKAVAALEPLGESAELAMAYANMGLLSALRDDRAESAVWAEKAIELAVRLSRPELLADAYSALAMSQHWHDVEASRRTYRSALQIALEHDRQELAARVYTNYSCLEYNHRAHANAHRLLEEGLSYCRDRDLDMWWPYMRGWLADLLVREGRWVEGRAAAQEILDLRLPSPVGRFPATAAAARLHIRQGNGDIPFSLADLCFDEEPQRLFISAPIVGEKAWIDGVGHEEAIALLHRTAEAAARVGNAWAAGETTYWIRKLGGAAQTLSSVAAPWRSQLAGDWRAAAAAWASIPAPYEQALALAEGDEEARHQALAILDKLGAAATAARVRKELRERGVRRIARGPRASTRSNPVGLTRREIEVLRLIDAGFANAQIAKTLGLSVKTIDHHVSAVLAKLGASSRGEAAAQARKHQLLGNV